MAAEAAEKARVEREGLVLLRLKMADLFAKRDSISAKMDTSTDNIRGKLDECNSFFSTQMPSV